MDCIGEGSVPCVTPTLSPAVSDRSPVRMVASISFLLLVGAVVALSHPTIYMKKDEDTLSPVLVPVSSTVIPLPIYKVGYSINAKGKKVYDEDVKLITVKTKNKAKAKADVKALSREDFEKGVLDI